MSVETIQETINIQTEKIVKLERMVQQLRKDYLDLYALLTETPLNTEWLISEYTEDEINKLSTFG